MFPQMDFSGISWGTGCCWYSQLSHLKGCTAGGWICFLKLESNGNHSYNSFGSCIPKVQKDGLFQCNALTIRMLELIPSQPIASIPWFWAALLLSSSWPWGRWEAALCPLTQQPCCKVSDLSLSQRTVAASFEPRHFLQQQTHCFRKAMASPNFLFMMFFVRIFCWHCASVFFFFLQPR